MKSCKYCGKPIQSRNYCANCSMKVALIRKFLKVCDELKEIIGYDEILRMRGEKDNGDT